MNRLLYCDVHGVGLRDGHLNVLRHGHGHGVRDGHAHVACDGHVVRVRALRVRVLHLVAVPDVSATAVVAGGGQGAVARHCEDRQFLEKDKVRSINVLQSFSMISSISFNSLLSPLMVFNDL